VDAALLHDDADPNARRGTASALLESKVLLVGTAPTRREQEDEKAETKARALILFITSKRIIACVVVVFIISIIFITINGECQYLNYERTPSTPTDTMCSAGLKKGMRWLTVHSLSSSYGVFQIAIELLE
jgi:hypothetical protein